MYAFDCLCNTTTLKAFREVVEGSGQLAKKKIQLGFVSDIAAFLSLRRENHPQTDPENTNCTNIFFAYVSVVSKLRGLPDKAYLPGPTTSTKCHVRMSITKLLK